MRLIDADELQQLFNDVATNLLALPELTKDAEHMVRAFLMVTEMIQDAPTVEVEPVIAENATLKAERDAAVEDMTKLVKNTEHVFAISAGFMTGWNAVFFPVAVGNGAV